MQRLVFVAKVIQHITLIQLWINYDVEPMLNQHLFHFLCLLVNLCYLPASGLKPHSFHFIPYKTTLNYDKAIVQFVKDHHEISLHVKYANDIKNQQARDIEPILF